MRADDVTLMDATPNKGCCISLQAISHFEPPSRVVVAVAVACKKGSLAGARRRDVSPHEWETGNLPEGKEVGADIDVDITHTLSSPTPVAFAEAPSPSSPSLRISQVLENEPRYVLPRGTDMIQTKLTGPSLTGPESVVPPAIP